MDVKKNRLSLAYGIPGVSLQVLGLFGGLLLEEVNPQLAPIVGLSLSWLGVVLLIIGLGYYASAKGHHWAWGFMGLLSIIGLIVLGILPDRHHRQTALRSMPIDATDTVEVGGPVFRCFGCGYILNGITSPTCPECGKPFDAHDPASMQVTDDNGRDWLRKETPPWTSRWSLICGILTLVLFCLPPLNLFSAICGISFGHAARRAVRGNQSLRGSAGVALAGLIVSYIGLVVTLVFTAFIITAMMNQ